MIRRIRGILLEKRSDEVVVEAGGVGYGLAVPLSTVEALPAVGREVALFTHLRVRDDAQELFGFATAEARDLFERMLKVKGFSARAALSILSHLSPAEFRRVVAREDVEALVAVRGVGRKTAEKLLLELREAFAEEAGAEAEGADGEVLAALAALGYEPDEARRALALARKEVSPRADTAALIRAALKATR